MLKLFVSCGCLAVALCAQLPVNAAAAAGDAPRSTRSCARDADAAMSRPVPPDVPAIVREMRSETVGTALVKVDLLPSGALANASIYKSTGNPYLDRAALTAIRLSGFRPEVRDCTEIGGSYLVTVAFD